MLFRSQPTPTESPRDVSAHRSRRAGIGLQEPMGNGQTRDLRRLGKIHRKDVGKGLRSSGASPQIVPPCQKYNKNNNLLVNFGAQKRTRTIQRNQALREKVGQLVPIELQGFLRDCPTEIQVPERPTS